MPKGAIICSTAKDAEIWENLVGAESNNNQEMKNVAPLIYADENDDQEDYGADEEDDS